MKTVQTESGQLDANELLKIISQWKVPDLEGFAKKVLQIIEKKKTPEYKDREQYLIDKIKNGGPPEAVYIKKEELANKLLVGTMTPKENKEYIKIAKVIENWDYERLKLAIELSDLWDTDIKNIFIKLDLRKRPLNHV